jgi:hypothetical protein
LPLGLGTSSGRPSSSFNYAPLHFHLSVYICKTSGTKEKNNAERLTRLRHSSKRCKK